MNHIVALSGGKDSVAMALYLKQFHPDVDYTYVCTATGNELPEMVEHWKKIECLLGKKIINVCDLSLIELAYKMEMIPNFRARWCTRIIKIQRFIKWLSDNTPATIYVGLRADEEDREGGNYENIPDLTVSYPLREAGWNKVKVLSYLRNLGISIPQRTDCALCFYQTMSEWWRLWKYYPEYFAEGIKLEDDISKIRGKKCTFRNEKKDKWGTSLREMSWDFESGKVPKNRLGIPANQMSFEMDDERDAMCSFCAR